MPTPELDLDLEQFGSRPETKYDLLTKNLYNFCKFILLNDPILPCLYTLGAYAPIY
jgi:hypothetical protein